MIGSSDLVSMIDALVLVACFLLLIYITKAKLV